MLAEVVVEADHLAVDINVAIHLLCQKLRKLRSLPSRSGQLLDSNSLFLEPLVRTRTTVQTAHLQMKRMDKLNPQAQVTRARAHVVGAADMGEVKVWL